MLCYQQGCIQGLPGIFLQHALIIIGYVVNGVLPTGLEKGWGELVSVCMISLTVVISLFTLFAILRNIKLGTKWNKDGKI